MSERRGRALRVAVLLLLVALPPAAAQDEYPADISPPPGTRYPCALTALPPGLPGIPEPDRAFINRTYARVLKATQAKLVLLRALEQQQETAARLARYQETTGAMLGRQAAETVPAGLEPFQQDLLRAFELQRSFFSKAAVARERGDGMEEVYRIPEGRQASGHLIAAWGRMQARYPGWPSETSGSIYHHLCALDLF